MKQICGNCRFMGRSDHWHSLGLNSGPACHFNPPAAIGTTGKAEWPMVDPEEDWCAKWELYQEDRVEEAA